MAITYINLYLSVESSIPNNNCRTDIMYAIAKRSMLSAILSSSLGWIKFDTNP